MTTIDIFSGFLGAGKTTLIKKLLKESLAGEQVVLIENEFGEIGIDGGFMKEAGIQVTEMNSGCICCSLVGDFGVALRQVIDQYHPDRILIEPSGVGKLSDVIRAVEGVERDIDEARMGSFVTVADAVKCRMYVKNFGEFFLNQIEYAGTILLSRTQNLSQEKLEAVVALLREHNAKARIITTPWDELSGDVIMAAMNEDHTLAEEMLSAVMAQPYDEEEEEEHHHHHHHDHDEDEHEHEHHHHHDDDDDEDEHEHEHHHHDDDDDEDEHEHEHHHHHDHDEDHDEDHDHHHEHENEEDEHHDHHHHDHDGHHHHHHHHHGHDADEIFDSWGVETVRKFSEADLSAMLSALEDERYGVILRAKGIVPAADGGWIHFDYTPGEQNVRRGPADYTGRLCVIGSKLDTQALGELFGVA
ncbi:MAG: GTP-binding protein [Clostridia bacterium]|nr:GTP-binding protein [Clostridia bacterium]